MIAIPLLVPGPVWHVLCFYSNCNGYGCTAFWPFGFHLRRRSHCVITHLIGMCVWWLFKYVGW